ncbi:MAG: 4Fe-4S dicluster domain-containing protein [Armatimonadota bacterium]
MARAAATDRIIVSDDKSFNDKISKLSGQNITSCYQCGECTGGCPVAYTADLTPNQVSRLVQLGQDKTVLESRMIWLCVGCETCSTRCPRGIELSKVMDALREVSIEEGIAPGEPKIKTFHNTFLSSVEHIGRIHEVTMLGEFKLRTLDLFSDIFLGIKMFLKGKLAIEPSFVKSRAELKRIFKKKHRS